MTEPQNRMEETHVGVLTDWACLSLLPTSTWTRQNLAVGIAETFREREITFSKATLPTSREEVAAINEELIRKSQRLKETGRRCLFFGLNFDSFIYESTFAQLKKRGFLIVNYCIDMYNQWYKHCRDALHYDAIAVAQSMNREQVDRCFRKSVWMPMAATRAAQASHVDASQRIVPSLCLLGSRTEYRTFIATRMGKQEVPMDVFGGRWTERAAAGQWSPYTKVPRAHAGHLWILLRGYGPAALAHRTLQHYLDGLRYKRIMKENARFPDCIRLHGFSERQAEDLFKEHLINLGTSHKGGGWGEDGVCRYTQGRARDFEVTASGAFYLAQWHPDIDGFFESGKEIDTWRSVDELIGKSRYYFDKPEEARRLGRNARLRVEREHTWVHRFEGLIAELA